MSKTALIYCLITVVAWGIGSVMDKVLVGSKGLSPCTAAFLRMLIGTAAVSSYAIYGGALAEVSALAHLDRPALWTLIGALIGSAMLGSFVGQVSYFHAMQESDASLTVPLTSTYPLVGAFLAILFLREPLTAQKVAGAVLIVAGMMMLTGGWLHRSA